jgi:hypothetical protein
MGDRRDHYDPSADLETLLGGAARWLTSHLELFDPFAGPDRSSPKAALELALLCRCWARARPGDARLDAAARLLRGIWREPRFAELIAADPARARLFGVLAAALAPPGAASEPSAAAAATITAAGLSAEQVAYLRLETRYFLDLARADGDRPPVAPTYADLYRSTILARLAPGEPVTVPDRYLIAHAICYLSDFGFDVPPLIQDDLKRIDGIVSQLSEASLRDLDWDLASMLLLAKFCLRHDAARTPLGESMLRALVRAQRADGAIATSAAASSAQAAYHPTLVAALASCVLSSAGPRAAAKPR